MLMLVYVICVLIGIACSVYFIVIITTYVKLVLVSQYILL